MPRRKATVVAVTAADEHNQVVTVRGHGGSRRTPCQECPWRTQNAGSFPAEAFRVSAHTAYDMAQETFGCHMTTPQHPTTCAGFLLRNAANNLAVRLNIIHGDIDPAQISADGADLFDSYRSMAQANGVDPDDPVLHPCRSDHD